MKIVRRKIFYLAAGAVVSPVPCVRARAEPYPSRPIHVLVGFPPGSPPDIVARIVGSALAERLGQPAIIENRPGAASNIATEIVVRAPPDGYTLLLITAANATNASIYRSLNFDFIRDIAPIARIDSAPFVMVVNPSLPVHSVPEFIAYAKANPGKINMASPGIGSGGHIYGALFEMMAGVKLVHIPYHANFMPDLLSGVVQVSFVPVEAPLGYIRSGELRALAVTAAMRSEALPDTSTISETVPGYEAIGWLGLGGPKDTPEQIIERLNAETTSVLADPIVRMQLIKLGAKPAAMTSAEFGHFIALETDKWRTVVKFAGIPAQ